MRPLIAGALAGLLPIAALGQAPAAPEAVASVPDEATTAWTAAPLQPFLATYNVLHNGRALGTATMQLQADAGTANGWRIDLTLRGGGLARLTGLNIQQSTAFDVHDGHYRPLQQNTTKRAFLASRKSTGRYDWAAGTAQWSGDIKAARRAPVALQPGDMSGLLINLAVIRDARPGQSLRYRFVDDGRVRDHAYQAAAQTESLQAGELGYDALRVQRVQNDGDSTVIWVANGVPTPIRLLQQDADGTQTDLQLIEYH